MDFDFQAELPSLDAIPEPYRLFYQPVEGKDGVVLSDPLLRKRLDDSGLRGALEKERKNSRSYEAQLKKFKALADDPDALSAQLNELNEELHTLRTGRDAKLRELEEALAAKGDGKEHLDKIRKEVEQGFRRKEADFKNAIAEKEARIERLQKALNRQIIEGAATAALASAKGNVRVLLPHVTRQIKVLEENGDYVARVVDGDGEIRYNSRGEPMSFSDLVAEMRQDADFQAAFDSSGSSGSGAKGTGTGSGGGGKVQKVYSSKDWRALMAKAKPEERAQLMKDAAAGRIQIRD